MMIRHFLSDFQPLWTDEPVAKSCKMTFYTKSYRTWPNINGFLWLRICEFRTAIIWNALEYFSKYFHSIYEMNFMNGWLTETLCIFATLFMCCERCLQFLVWHPLECERDDSSGGKSMWKRKGFENVEMASIHHDEDSPIHNIWSLHCCCCCCGPPH